MSAKDKLYAVKNRSASMVVYKIPEDGIRREFAPGESKRIKYAELEKLSYQAGGRALMTNFLQIVDEYTNKDRSREIQVYKKVGVVAMLANNICAYVDTALMGQMDTWNLDGITGKVATYDGRLDGSLKV